MKRQILSILIIMLFSLNFVYATNIAKILNKEKERISSTIETTKTIEETKKVIEESESIIKENNSLIETTDAYVEDINEYEGLDLGDLIAEEIISLNDTKYDYGVFIKLLNIDKNINFIINDGEIILNFKSSLNYINKYIDKNDFVVFSNYNKKNNSIRVTIIKEKNTIETNSYNNENNTEIVEEENTNATYSQIDNDINEYKEQKTLKKPLKNIFGTKISTNSESFGTDRYGNKIENDSNAWVGEDSGNINDIEESKIYNIENNIDIENSGILNVVLDDGLDVKNSNLKIVLLDNTYTLYNLFIYYRNDYKEKMNLPIGKYKVNQVVNLNSNVQDLITNVDTLNISKENPFEIIICKNNEVKEINSVNDVATKSTISEIKQENKINIIFTIIQIVAILAVLLIIYLIIKKILKNKFENQE